MNGWVREHTSADGAAWENSQLRAVEKAQARTSYIAVRRTFWFIFGWSRWGFQQSGLLFLSPCFTQVVVSDYRIWCIRMLAPCSGVVERKLLSLGGSHTLLLSKGLCV